MKYDVIAYCWNDALAGFTREDAQRLTHVNLAFGLLKDGLLDLHLLKYLHLLPKLREWNPEMKIVLSVGGWGADGFSDMAMTEEGRRNFAKSCLDAVEKYNLDGIDIDWEYPCSDAAGIGADPRDKENFTALLATLREYLGKDRIVSIAVGASQRCIADTQMDKVAEIVDYVQLMTYDMVDGTRAGHHAALGATKGDKSGLNTRDTVEAYTGRAFPTKRSSLARHSTAGTLRSRPLKITVFCSPPAADCPAPLMGRSPRNISGRTISRFIGMLMRRQTICGTAGLSSATSLPRRCA